jgi:formate dehydrogenase subunit delta
VEAEKLVKMANQIAAFFDAEPDRKAALDGIASHLKRFWDPRMRRELLRFVDEHAGQGLSESALAAIHDNRTQLTPDDP